jgi:diguanylate cyclase (GGDEF)-like protein
MEGVVGSNPIRSTTADLDGPPSAPGRWGSVASGLRQLVAVEAPTARELRSTTLRRLRTVALVAVPVSAAHLVAFALLDPATPAERRWRAGILVAHALLAAAMGAVALLARHLDEDRPLARVLPWAALALVLGVGAGIAAVDQLVTTAITPFLVACAVAGLVLLLPPLPAAGGYLAGWLAFVWAVGRTQADPSVALSNRVNGLTAVGIGIGLTLLQWRAEVRNVRQARHIEAQQAELVARNAELDLLATHDELTGLPNRRRFEEQVADELARMRRRRHASSLLLLDLDAFKAINDRLGHLAGDQLLREVAAVLRERMRATDVVARWGGEEFVVLLPETTLDGARGIAEQLRATVAGAELVDGAAGMTISIGVAALDASVEQPLERAYGAADRALYAAKAAGRDRVEVADTHPIGP